MLLLLALTFYYFLLHRVYGAAHLVKPIVLANQWIQYCVSSPTQRALATIIEEADKAYEGYDTYYDFIRHHYMVKRDFLAKVYFHHNCITSIIFYR